jgi:dTMP kinase
MSEHPGRFLVLDGTDGCGKSTQIPLLGKVFEQRGFSVLQTYDPGGTEIGDQIRTLLKYSAKGRMDVHTETMLFMASRAQLVSEVIRPALAEGKVVLCDRFVSSTCAYQGAGGYPVQEILELARYAIGCTWPDLTIVLDLPAEKGRHRTGVRNGQAPAPDGKPNTPEDRFDTRSLDYYQRVREGFLALPKYYPSPVEIVNTDGLSIEEVHQRIVSLLEQRKWF